MQKLLFKTLSLFFILIIASANVYGADLITLDGSASDWKCTQSVYNDPKGNVSVNMDNADLKRVLTAMDDNFAYIMIETYGKPINPDIIVEMNMDFQPGWRHWPGLQDDLHTNIYSSYFVGCTGNFTDGNFNCVTYEDVEVVWGDVLEVKIPLNTLNNPDYFRTSMADFWLNGQKISRSGDTVPTLADGNLNSRHKKFDPKFFPFDEDSPYYNGKSHWYMLASGWSRIQPNFPIYIDSDMTGKQEMSYYPFPIQWGFNYHAVYHDYEDPEYGGPYPSPGPGWEGKTYLFYLENQIREFYIPNGSLQALQIPETTITGSTHPTICWDSVPGADYYRIYIHSLDHRGYPDQNYAVFISGALNNTCYTYTGDLFAYGQAYAIRVQARQRHPHAANDSNYSWATINRSEYFTKHSIGTQATIDTLPPSGAVHAYNNLIWPPNNKMVSIELEGYVRDEASIIRDGEGVGISSAYLLINNTEQITLFDETINKLDSKGNFAETVELKAVKGSAYTIELFASDTNSESSGGPNTDIVDTTIVRVATDMSKGK